MLASAPAFAYTAIIRYVTRERPHLGGAWHWPDNVEGIGEHLLYSPFDYHRPDYLYIFFIFGVLWIYALRGLGQKPTFVRNSLLMVPFFIVPHLLTGIIHEARQMIPLAFVIIPASLLWIQSQTSTQEAVPA